MAEVLPYPFDQFSGKFREAFESSTASSEARKCEILPPWTNCCFVGQTQGRLKLEMVFSCRKGYPLALFQVFSSKRNLDASILKRGAQLIVKHWQRLFQTEYLVSIYDEFNTQFRTASTVFQMSDVVLKACIRLTREHYGDVALYHPPDDVIGGRSVAIPSELEFYATFPAQSIGRPKEVPPNSIMTKAWTNEKAPYRVAWKYPRLSFPQFSRPFCSGSFGLV